jgi:hypothetical protein
MVLPSVTRWPRLGLVAALICSAAVLGLWLATAPVPATAAAPRGAAPRLAASSTFTPTDYLYLPLIFKPGVPPSVTCFNATPPSVSLGSSSLLNWCVTGAVTTTISPGLGVVTGTFAVVTPTATTIYVLQAFNPFGVVTRTTTVAVTGGLPCGNIAAVDHWVGTLGFSYGRSASDSGESVSLQRGGNVTFYIQQSSSGPSGVSWIGFASGNVNINDRHVAFGTPDQVSTLIGSSAPITLVQGIEEHSRITLNVRYSDCTYNFSFDPYVQATEHDANTPPFQIEASVGSIRSDRRALPGTSGSANFSAHSQIWADDGSDAYFPPWAFVGAGTLFPNEGSLGSASVSWSFEITSP